MARKYKTTGCAKFFFVIIVLAPLAYMGASYYNGQDGWSNLKSLFGSNRSATQVDTDQNVSDQVKDLSDELNDLKAEKERLEAELKACMEGSND